MLGAPLSTKRSDGIDLLRALFALWVVFAHLIPWAQYVQGPDAVPAAMTLLMRGLALLFQPVGELHPAVLGFIVLSGYCIHRNGFRRTAGDLAEYSVRRAFRIYPVYALATLTGLVGFVASLSLAPAAARALSGTDELSVMFILVKLSGLSAFVPAWNDGAFQGNAPLATVMVEMWLYAFYPALIILVVRRHGERALWLLLVATWLLGVTLITARPDLQGWWHNGSLIGFLPYWWIGAKCVDPDFVAALSRRRIALSVGWVVLTLLLVAGATRTPLVAELRKVALALLIGFGIARLDQAAPMLFHRTAFIGRAGYSLYAFHAPILYGLLIAGYAWWSAFLAVLAIGAAMFNAVERPFMRFGKRLFVAPVPAPRPAK
jgi:peptidoglycan/LPS O-acetylase OafA/YrhL